MNAPGIYDLNDLQLSGADTYLSDEVDGLEGVVALSAQLRLFHGGGGTSAKAYLQTSLDQGSTWVDIACVVYGTTSETALLNFSGLTPKLTAVVPTDGALADDTAIDGILGDRFRLKVVTVGTYTGSTVVSGRLCAR